ncbi:MAG: imidazoleglycerol-phosphate dehydratase [Candidatus Eremiobacteraeota bacterium]|nr:imidazoleglycerol-phosphate dehydratase [Candidatus Eremiobacteraeota bacterium]MEA2718782.1 imidazoleglycerol-phosphate dehydratase [Candidatus Eremiobacteraeota bacterium]
MNGSRTALVRRETKETNIDLRVSLDGGAISVETDVDFFDHMLTALATHAGLGFELVAHGDGMDHHHLIEDVGIALGRCIDEALGDKRGIARFGSIAVPLDDALVQCAVDLSGRPWLNYDVPFSVPALGALPTELVPHFFRSVVDHGKFNLHLLRWAGTNNHHLCEAAFKSFARAFAQAKTVTASADIPSTKGSLTERAS